MNLFTQYTQWLDGAGIEPWMVATATLLVVAAALLLLAHLLASRRTRMITIALDESVRGKLAFTDAPRAGRLRVEYAPPPDPCVQLSVDFSMGDGGLFGPLQALFTRRQRLALHASLPAMPQSELVWHAAHEPDQALGRSAATELWVNHRLVYGPGEYAVRGANAAALQHTFVEMQTRFGPFLRAVIVQAAVPHIRVRLEAGRLNREEIPALITAIRTLARAALVG
jgi:hypothetical protein